MIGAILERCAGIDVGKKFCVVCVMTGAAHEEPQTETRQYGTTPGQLEGLRQWLLEKGCTHVVMESTGSYWKPIFNVLEGSLEVVLANARHVKNMPGRKTDRSDAYWLAHLLRHGLIAASFIPPREIRDLRDLTRRRRKLMAAGAQERNRVQKELESANVKLGSVLSDLFGVSGQRMLEALLEDRLGAQEIAQFAQRRLKKKIPEIIAALEGHRLREHHRFMIRQSLEHMAFLEEQVQVLDEQILEKLKPYQREMELLETVPGVKTVAAASILAETGPDMRQFRDGHHLASWAGVCPGNNESAGKHKSSHIRRGNRFLLATLAEAAWAASRTNGSAFQARFHRLVPRRGKKRALVGVAHSLLLVVHAMLRNGVPYQELDSPYLSERRRQAQVHYHMRCLKRLGVPIMLMEGSDGEDLAVLEDPAETPPTRFVPPPAAQVGEGDSAPHI
jgi:transposase